MRVKNKKIILITLFALTIFLLSPTSVAAQGGELDITGKLTNVGTSAGFSAATETSLATTIGTIIKAFLSLLGVIFMSYIIYAGYLWMTAQGNEEQINKAKAIIRASIIGIIIILAAYAITAFVIDQLMATTGFTG